MYNLLFLQGRLRSGNTCIPESQTLGNRDVRIIKSTKSLRFKDERLVLTIDKSVPFLVYSSIPFTKGQRIGRYDFFYSISVL